jgi:hypothetical protein
MHRQTTAMTQPTITADIHEALDIHSNLTPKITLNRVIGINDFTQASELGLGEILASGIGIHPGPAQYLVASSTPNAIDIRQTDLNTLLVGDIHTRNTCHSLPPHYETWSARRGVLVVPFRSLALSLLVPRILTDHTDDSLPPHNLAFVTTPLDRRSDFHRFTPIHHNPQALKPGQNIRTILCYRDGVLKVSR